MSSCGNTIPNSTYLIVPPYPVGTCHGGGVVFYVNTDVTAPIGQRGLIVAPTDADGTTGDGVTLITGCTAAVGGNPAICDWDTTGSTVVTYINTNPALYLTGFQNTTDIQNAATAGTWSAGTAALDYNTTKPPGVCNGCTNWYLPSRDELAQLYFQSTNTASFGANCAGYAALSNMNNYWSSTQINSTTAWMVSFLAVTPTGVTSDTTSTKHPIRTIRAF